MCQFLINTLEDDVFGHPMDHITGEAIAEGNPQSVKDLLELFCVMSDEFSKRSPLTGIM
jgi:disulfide oxidoreductase YuzD